MIERIACEKGQMTVELCVVFPVVIAVAVIVVNAMSFFGYCGEFDRVCRNSVRVVAASPGAGKTKSMEAAEIKARIDESITAQNIECRVRVTSNAQGFDCYKATLEYSPTLFGMGLKSSVFGVRLPALKHTSSLTVDPYKPGEVF